MSAMNAGQLELHEICLRDPFLLTLPDGTYRLYGTTDLNPWSGPGTGFESYNSTDLTHWTGPVSVFRPPEKFWGTSQFWAPEVHFWQGSWYMLATFAGVDGRRGTQVLHSSSPDGPFAPASPQPVTPTGWMCLDGTLHTDPQGDPWLIFCREWLEVTDGQIWAQRLTHDLGSAIGDPHLLFSASEAPWTRPLPPGETGGITNAYVTDGPFICDTTGGLVMTWSSRTETGYAVGIARSRTGSILGPWVHDPKPLWDADGGHAMVSHSRTGETLLVLHAPNDSPFERPRIFPISFTADETTITRPTADDRLGAWI